jgi:hypothetical protein
MQRTDRPLASVHTRAGRIIDVAVLTLPGVPVAGAVTVSMACAQFDDHDRLWLSLSAAEAARLADALALAVERLSTY